MHHAPSQTLHNHVNALFPAASQDVLVQQLHHIFPENYMVNNARKHVNVKYPVTGSNLEVDVWIPDLNLGFEFQDLYHYTPTWYSHKTLAQIQGKDIIKYGILMNLGISVVIVPCWWSGTIKSLVGTIFFQRPDIPLTITATDEPIPLNPPPSYFQKHKKIPDVGEFMLASFTEEKFLVSPDTWWMGEKYDGVRSCWHPKLKIAYTRSGSSLPLLPDLHSSLPQIISDGEFWFGRGLYSNTFMLFNGALEGVQWHLMKFVVFDSPAIPFHHLPFEKRYFHLLSNIDLNDSLVTVAPRVLCNDTMHVDMFVQNIIENGGEGVILRQIHSRYRFGRTSTLFKLKSSFGDKEAIVVSLSQDAAELAMPNGLTFSAPLPGNVELTIGDVVTISYDINSRREVPTNPKILRIRTDLSWEDVVNSDQTHTSSDQGFTSQPVGFWTEKNMKTFLENVALARNEDPARAETWYKVQSKEIGQIKGGASILNKFRGYAKTVQNLFPDIQFEETSFSRPAWSDVDKRRKFFEQFANDNGFSSANPENWYAQPPELIMSAKGAAGVVRYHKNLAQALVDLFPEIGLEKKRFGEQYLWNSPSKQRKFFENFAKVNGFDPYRAENWYSAQKDKILAVKGVYNILYYHKNSLPQALLDLFPDIGLIRSKLMPQLSNPRPPVKTRQRGGFWTAADLKNTRDFFAGYAKRRNFDPLVAANWYSTSRQNVVDEDGGRLLSVFGGSFITALLQVYPDIGLDDSKFSFPKRNFWADKNKRKQLFVNFAKKRNFDPLNPKNWYSIPQKVIASTKEKRMAHLISLYSGSYAAALMDLFPNIGIDPSKFNRAKKGYYADAKNRRKFFDFFAAKKNLNPLLPDTWYSIAMRHVTREKGWAAVLNYHDGSFPNAVISLYPDIGLDPTMFHNRNKLQHAKDEETEISFDEKTAKDPIASIRYRDKLFFDRFASYNGIDPLIPTNWYRFNSSRISQEKGGRDVLRRYRGSLAQALMELYPKIGLDPHQFYTKKIQQSFWTKKENVKLFADTLARKHGFAPDSSLERWYKLRRSDVTNEPGGLTILNHFKGSLSAALASVYPNLKPNKVYGHPEEKRRKFFDSVAKSKGFDPLVPSNWLSMQAKEILSIKGGPAILAEFSGSIPLAIKNTYP
eukprot:Phypoly_transcript_01299.p1 GENE.Phypoly_transcript_01299~~Phypoly_transcript_01299.p1  ORF type:complete len:1145 (+),score=200.33 Phypoly_transcript_01299:2-3436(+)